MTPNLTGKTLSKYRILEEIGRGGMGVVYKAHDPLLDRLVAIKVLAPQLAWDQEFVQRFLNEARAAARLRHDHIVTIYDIGESEGYHFIVMDYLAGRPLSTLILQEGPLPPERVARLLAQIARALDYAHARGFIHRDVKPGNVVVSPQDRATLTDFGLARAMAGTRLTRSGMMLGTPAYMSPEQVQGEHLMPATDIYSLGIVAYEMLTRRAPFDADTPHAVMYAQVHKRPPPLRDLNARVPPAVQAAVLKTLAKKPADRWPSAGAFAQALRRSAARGAAGREGASGGLDLRRLAMFLGAGLAAAVLLMVVAAFAIGRIGGGAATPAPTEPAVVVQSPSTPVAASTEIPPTATLAPTSPPAPTATHAASTKPVIVIVTSTPVPTSTPTRPTATLVLTRTPAPTATLLPTRLPTPTRTPTRVPSPTRTPVPTRTHTPPPPTASQAVTLLEPANGAQEQGLVTFRWGRAGTLGRDEIFDVRVCKGEGCQPQFGKTNTGDTFWQWQPDDGAGTYRWQVVVIRKEGERVVDVAGSAVRQFEWSGGGGGGRPQPQPSPTR